MPFELSRTTVRLAAFNTRRELHGEDPQPAADLKIDMKLGSDQLALFHPALRSMLYHYDSQVGGDLVDAAHKDSDPNYAPHVRFPKMGPLKWDDEIVGATVTVHYGVKSEIVLSGSNVAKFHMEPQNGGTVALSFLIQAHPDEKQAGKLYTMNGSDIELTIEPPESEQTDLDDEK